MSQIDINYIIKDAITTAMMIAAPFLIASAVIGLIVSIVQAATQVQEQSIAFIVKIVAVGLILILLGSWLITTMIDFSGRIFEFANNV